MSGRNQRASGVETHFLPAARATAEELKAEVRVVSGSPVVEAMLRINGGALVVLNQQRQVVAVNDAYLVQLGYQDGLDPLGLRPGEAAGCVNARSGPNGCGTGHACKTCGAALALLEAQRTGRPQERECALRADHGHGPIDLALRVRAVSLEVDGEQFIVALFDDVSAEKRHQEFERTFFHDVNNLLTGLLSAVDELSSPLPQGGVEAARAIGALSLRLAQEVRVQRTLAEGDPLLCPVRTALLSAGAELDAVRDLCAHHPSGRERRLEALVEGACYFESDATLVERVLRNMTLNALEATARGGLVRLAVAPQEGGRVRFTAWNGGAIPEAVRPRIFQRFFSTKPGGGHGVGTYSMRLIGEQVLGGKVAFTSSAQDGTTFSLELPPAPPAR